MYNSLMINVDELWLKGKNRPQYFILLRRHIVTILKNFHRHSYHLKNESQRFVLYSDVAFSDEFINACKLIPGISFIVPSVRIPTNMSGDLTDLIALAQGEIAQLMKERPQGFTFKVETFRIEKRFPIPSMQVSRELGHFILKQFPLVKVDVHHHQIKVEVRILNSHSYISCRKIAGTGGLPVGSAGKAIALLSGGFDSPVASYLLMRRGLESVYAFFHAYPFVGDEVKEKIKQLAAQLGKFQRCTYLYVMPYGEIQSYISEHCLPEYRTLFFRKYMLQVASLLADKLQASCLITGDSLGQVSSQTLENILLLDQTSPKTIFRPLIGLNKAEIIELSKKIGTHDISVQPQDDACSLFSVKHPVLRPKLDYWNQFSSEHDLSLLIGKCVEQCERYAITPRAEVKLIYKDPIPASSTNEHKDLA